MSTRVLRSAKGKAHAAGEKGLVMGPVRDWGKKSIVISGGTQYTLEDVSKWEEMGKFKVVRAALKKAHDVGWEMWHKERTTHTTWMDAEDGAIMEVGGSELEKNESEWAETFKQGVAVQEVDEEGTTVVREESEGEIRDVVHVKGLLTVMFFHTPKKDKGKDRAREVSPSPAPKRKTHKGLSLESIQEGLDDTWSPDRRGINELPESVTSWGPGQLEGRGNFEETGEEAEALGFKDSKEAFSVLGPDGEAKGPFRPGNPLPVCLEKKEDQDINTSQDGKCDPALDAMMAGMKTPTPKIPGQGQEWTEHYGLDPQGFRTVRYFTGPPLPPVDPRYNWEKEKKDEVVPPTPDTSQAVPLFASIEAAQRRLAQAGAAPIAPATPLPIPPATPLPLRAKQETDEERDIDAGGVVLAFPETWDEAMRDADEREKKEEGLQDSRHAPKRIGEKGKCHGALT